MKLDRSERAGLFTSLWVILAGLSIYYGLPWWTQGFCVVQMVMSVLIGLVYSGLEIELARHVSKTILKSDNANTSTQSK